MDEKGKGELEVFNSGQNTGIEALALELSQTIFRYLTESGKKEDENMSRLGSIRLVSKSWNSLADNTIFSLYWKWLGETQLPQLLTFVKAINQEDQGQEKISFFERFTLLTQNLQKSGARIPSNRPMLGILSSTYEQKQRELDTALETIWDRIQQKIVFNGAPVPQNAAAIRTWLNDPANAPLINQITELDLSNLKLTVLPSEIGKFTQLTKLSLSSNQLTSLPESIGNLTQLTELFLCDNRLTSLPESIGNLTQLTELFLCDNRLTSLPESIGKLTQLTELSLWSNQLASLPESIGNLTQLTVLSLGINRLTSLPESIGNLTQLIQLYLENNRLASLPESIGNLTQLTELYLASNQNGFDDNLFMFILNKDLVKFDINRYFIATNVLQKRSACTNYQCQTPLAALCQAIHSGKSVDGLMQRLEFLPNEMRQRIESKLKTLDSCPTEELREDPVVNTLLFTKAVIEALQEQFSKLSPGQKKLMHWHIWNLAGRPQGDSNWGENHAEDNIIRLIDAMGFAVSPSGKQ